MELGTSFETNLIQLVRQNSVLYDKADKRYFDTLYKNNCWIRIGNTLNRSSGECKSRWKHLRENFVRNFKLKPPGSGKDIMWPYFEEMIFLKEFIKSRKRRGGSNCNEDSQDEESIITFKDEENTTSTFSITYSEVLPKQESITPVPVAISASNRSPPMPAPMRPTSPPAKKKKSNMLDEIDNHFMQTLSALKEYLHESIECEDRDVKNFSETVSHLYQELNETHRKRAKAHIIKYLGDMISNQLLNT